jgi:large subunit ribosomal protein L11
MAKKKIEYVKLVIAARKANPAPPVGTALGPRGVNMMEFCKQFNAETERLGFEVGVRVPVIVAIEGEKDSKNRKFSFVIKTPPTTDLIKKYAKITKGSSDTKKKDHIGEITIAHCEEIAKIKLVDLNTENIEAAISMIAGSAESMGVKVVR